MQKNRSNLWNIIIHNQNGICAKAILKGWCTGCQQLESIYFKGVKTCKYVNIPTAEDSIKQIKENLGIQEKLEL